MSKALAATIGGNYETLTDADKELNNSILVADRLSLSRFDKSFSIFLHKGTYNTCPLMWGGG